MGTAPLSEWQLSLPGNSFGIWRYDSDPVPQGELGAPAKVSTDYIAYMNLYGGVSVECD